jgi:hypothetical protein
MAIYMSFIRNFRIVPVPDHLSRMSSFQCLIADVVNHILRQFECSNQELQSTIKPQAQQKLRLNLGSYYFFDFLYD